MKNKQIKKEMKKWKKILYALLVGFAVVSFWRAVWGLSDEYLFPKNHELSLWISLVLGIGILILTHKIIRELM